MDSDNDLVCRILTDERIGARLCRFDEVVWAAVLRSGLFVRATRKR